MVSTGLKESARSLLQFVAKSGRNLSSGKQGTKFDRDLATTGEFQAASENRMTGKEEGQSQFEKISRKLWWRKRKRTETWELLVTENR